MKDIEKEIPAGGSLEIRSSSFTPYSGSFAPPSDSFGKEFFGGDWMSKDWGLSRFHLNDGLASTLQVLKGICSKLLSPNSLPYGRPDLIKYELLSKSLRKGAI